MHRIFQAHQMQHERDSWLGFARAIRLLVDIYAGFHIMIATRGGNFSFCCFCLVEVAAMYEALTHGSSSPLSLPG